MLVADKQTVALKGCLTSAVHSISSVSFIAGTCVRPRCVGAQSINITRRLWSTFINICRSSLKSPLCLHIYEPLHNKCCVWISPSYHCSNVPKCCMGEQHHIPTNMKAYVYFSVQCTLTELQVHGACTCYTWMYITIECAKLWQWKTIWQMSVRLVTA